jgi:hypothetical protein
MIKWKRMYDFSLSYGLTLRLLEIILVNMEMRQGTNEKKACLKQDNLKKEKVRRE